MSDAKEEPLSIAKELSLLTDAVTQISMTAGCPDDCRSFIDGLISISEGASRLAISDEMLANRIRSNAGDVGTAANQKWVQRKREKLEKWQDETGIVFIECEHGYRTRDGWHPSKYQLTILDYAEQVIAAARKNAYWEKDRHFAIGAEAIEFVSRLEGQTRRTRKRKRSRGDYRDAIRRIRSARTNLTEAVSIITSMNAQIDINDKESIDELEKLILELKDRVNKGS